MPADAFTFERAAMITALALGNKIPAVYPFPRFAVEGGLIAYGVDLADQLHNAGGYAARILKGDLPIQTPTRYALTINIKTAKALGLTVPASLFARADEVIE